MKKCLLSILAGALLIVSCQNYDDQFDDLNSQITALASQVAGLSKVQSDLTALQGTVSSLQGNIASSVDSALASGLAGINAAVDNLQSQIDGIASSEEVAAIQSDVTAAQEDLTELLNNSNVFTGDLEVTTASQLNAALAYGTKIAIVNGDVNFAVDASMNIDSVQTVVNRIGTVVKDFSYVAATSSVSPVSFDNITGVTSLTVKQAGDYSFKGLESATNVFLNDGFKSKVKIIHFGALKTVTTFTTVTSTGSDDHAIVFPKVTELHLTSLQRYSGGTSANPLKLHIDEGTAAAPTVIAMGTIEDKDASGKQKDLHLSIEGPNSVAITKLTDGSVKLRNVIDASVNGFTGAITLMDGVQNFSADNVTSLTHSAANDLKTLDITGVVDPDTAAASQAAGLPVISFDTGNNGDIETIKIRGAVKSVTAKSAGSLTSVDLAGADVGGAITMKNNTDLVTLDVTGTKMAALEIDTNADLESVNANGTFRAAIGGTKIDGSITIKDNSSLTAVTLGMAGLNTLTITGNDDLTTIASTLTTVGASGGPTVTISDNDFIATSVTDDEEAVGVTSEEGKANDAGTFTTSSGMETMKNYLTAVAADSKATANVYWDSVESYTTEAGVETNDYVYAAGTIATTKQLWILNKV
jgi:prefoldin subunit 5